MNLLKRFSLSLKGFMLKSVAPCAAVALLSFAAPSDIFAQTGTSSNGESLVYGYLGYCPMDAGDDLGLYTISPEGELTLVWKDQKIGFMGTYVAAMWTDGGQLHALYGNTTKYFHLSFDFATGAPMLEDEIDIVGENAYKYIRRGAYNPNDGYIYGYSWNADESKDYFVKCPASNPHDVTIIREMPVNFVACAANCFNPEDNCMYGVDVYKSLVRVDVNGNFSYTNLITPSDVNLHGVVTGMVYSPKDKCFYWNARYEDYTSEYVKIDPTNVVDVPENGVMAQYIRTENVTWFRTWDAFISLFTFDTTGAADGPVAAETLDVSFPDGALSGSLTYKMPEKLANGSAAPASMKWEATNGVDTPQTGNAAPGEEVKVNYSNLDNNEYSFWFRAYAGEAQGEIEVNTVWIGPDMPYVPGNVTLASTGEKGKYLVKWSPVTKGAHNGYIVPENIVYAVYLNDEIHLATVKTNEAEVEIDDTGEETAYYITVYAIDGQRISEPGYSSVVYLGEGWPLPYTIVPTAQQLNMMTYINPEGDALGWRAFKYTQDMTVFYSGRDNINGGDDWLITPHFLFPDGNVQYELSYDVALYNQLIPEDYYEIWLGTEATAEGIRQQRILPKTKPIAQQFKREKHVFSIPSAGTYYIGFHCVSEPEQAGIVLKNITIQEAEGGAVTEVETSAVKVVGGKGCITLLGGKDDTLAIYTLSGALVYNGKPGIAGIVNVAPGVYVAVSNGKSFKVIVK